MSTSQFILEGYCQGAYPVDGLDEIACERWYNEILQAIRGNDPSEALRIAKEHFRAEYVTESISRFEDNDIRYIRTVGTNLDLPFIEDNGSTGIPLFRWVGAHFLMEAPTEIVSEWLQADDNGKQYFSQERFDDWIGDDNYLQDGCSYSLGGCLYDLEGFGENGCTIDGDSVVHGLSHISVISETGSFPSTSSESTSNLLAEIMVGRNNALLLPKKYVELVGLKSGDKAFISVQGKSVFVAQDSNENQISEISVLPSGNISISTDILEAIARAVEPGDEFFLGLGPDKTSLTITLV